MTFTAFLAAFVRVPDALTGALVPLTLHPAQAAVVAAVDARDGSGPRYREFALSWVRKSGKSTTLAALGLWGLLADEDNPVDREVILLAGDYDQARSIVFKQAARMVSRHPWLRERVQVTADALRFAETVQTPGGAVPTTHTLRVVSGADVRGLHGHDSTMVIIDEAWVFDSYDTLEGASPSAARTAARTILASYAGLRSQQREGVPWFDVVARGRAGDPALCFSHLSGPDAYAGIPWVKPGWIERMARTLPASKFSRMVLNIPAVAESAFLTADEVQDALTDQPEPLSGQPGVEYVGALDIGLTHDWSAFLWGHLDGPAFVIDGYRTWRGTKARPVSLAAVEGEIQRLAAGFRFTRVVADLWQAAAVAERLKSSGVPVSTVVMEAGRLNRITSLMKSAFSRRVVRLPARLTDLREQLDALVVEEAGRRNARRNMMRFTSGDGPGAAGHDDIAICLALCLEASERKLGRWAFPDTFRECIVAGYFHAAGTPHHAPTCFLLSPTGAIPSDPVCHKHCHGFKAVKDAHAAWGMAAGLDLRGVRASFAESEFTSRWLQRRAESFLHL